MNQPSICNKNVAPGCEAFESCGYPVSNLSNINKDELVNIFKLLCQANKSAPKAHIKRKIKAMEKILRFFDIYKETDVEGG